MTLSLALSNSLSGLRLNQRAIGVLSHNIANVNTEGYSRQIITQSALTLEGVGSGVRIDEITRKVDKYLQRSTQTQGSINSSSQTLNEYYQNIQNLLGQPGASNSIDSFLTGFFNSVQQMAETPESVSLKSNAVSSATTLAKQISDLAYNMNDLRFQADSDISDAVSTVNGALIRLYDLNTVLKQTKSLGQSTSGLLDERDKALNTLVEYLNISVSYEEAGAVSVVAGNGISLLEEGIRHKLSYNKASGGSTFIQDGVLRGLEVLTVNDQGQEVANRFELISAGKSSEVKTSLMSGKIDGLQQMRDVKLPDILAQLDELASHVRDAVNEIHNSGSAYPPPTSLTGDRTVRAGDQYSWQGALRIAVLQPDGKPVPSTYADENYTGIRPLTLDMSRLDSGQGNGKPTMQTIIDEINNHFGAPANKAELGNINNIQLASDTDRLPSGGISLFNFDLDLENISDTTAKVFVTGITVFDDTSTNITSVTQTAPSLTINPVGSYTTTIGSADVTISLLSPPGVVVGDKIYLNAPSAAVNGILTTELNGFFTVTAVSSNQVTFTSGGVATATGIVNDPGSIQVFPPYDTVAAGQQERTRDSGQMQVDFSSNIVSTYYDITLDVSVVGEDGVVNTAPITYRVKNNERDLYNRRYDATAIGGAGTLVLPESSQESLRAILIDADGNELATVNGKYVDADSYLKIIGGSGSSTPYSVAIDQMDSQQIGKPDDSPAQAGTNRGFSHYFGLNNLFASNELTTTGDLRRNSAVNLKVQDRFATNPALISLGNLAKLPKNIASGNREVFTYALYSGDNSVAQRMAQLNTKILSFESAGGLPQVQLSLQSYTDQVLGFVSQQSAESTATATNSQALYDGFKNKLDSVRSVNLDEELANTVTIQNAYSATARVITIVNKMYDDLMQTF